MSSTQKISFMPSSVKALKTMLKGIMGSYDNPWDLLAELSQNSVDAVRKRGVENSIIEFEFDPETARISIVDDGTGIDPNGAQDLFSPFGTNKEDDVDSVGEKGVGLKYVIFSTRKFTLTSYHSNGSFKVYVEDAANWLRSRDSELIYFTFESIDNPKALTGTHIHLELDNLEHPLLKLTFPQLKTLLLTKTAIGSTKPIWKNGNSENFKCTLKLKPTGKPWEEASFEPKYLLPTDVLTRKISNDDYESWRISSSPSDVQKRTKLKNKVIYDSDVYSSAGRDIKFWTCIMPSSDQWFKASELLGLVGAEDEENYSPEEHFYALHPDITLSTKGMPTTVTLEFHPRGDAGYKIQFFTIIEDDNLAFDIGRKGASVSPRTIGMYKKIAQMQFTEMLVHKRFLRGDAGETLDRFAKIDLFKEIHALTGLESEVSAFQKRPNKQEATVAAIFYELLGKGMFEGFKPYISGYRDTYDLTGTFDNQDLIIEFKYELLTLFKDFASNTKMFEDIDIVVIWEMTESARNKANSRNILLTALEEDDRRAFPNTHFSMIVDHARPIEVLELKRLIDG